MPQRDSISIVLCGEAGQGIQTIEAFLTKLFKSAGYYVFATKEYMSRIRGGSNSTEIRVSSRRCAAYAATIDILIPLDKDALPHLRRRIDPATKILGETAKIGPLDHLSVIEVPFSQIAAEIGNPVFANTVACGLIAGTFGIDPDLLAVYLRNFFAAKGPEIVAKNLTAATSGYQFGMELRESDRIVCDLTPVSTVQDDIIVSGAEAVALGALVGGCNFIASYPMSPGTGVLTHLAQYANDFPIVVEQAEDEIGAVNMALGAWYAGARAIVTTSGGGFDLMTEGVSLAGMIESPLVIHLAQRPGPATGLPTRTEQADLELALHAGHGEFPRIILAPGNAGEAFALTQQAFQLADRFQVPVFILTDQFLVDSYSTVPPFPLPDLPLKQEIVATAPDYRRYELTPGGLSPRGIPGFGQGLVGVDSDEHDEFGRITESSSVRKDMVEKRLRKIELLKTELEEPEFIGEENCEVLLLAWGSTWGPVTEAINMLNDGSDKKYGALVFGDIWPLPTKMLKEKAAIATHVINVEQNATGQLASIVSEVTGIFCTDSILKYDGRPMSSQFIYNKVRGNE